MHKAVEVWLLDIHGFEDLEEGKPAFGEGGFSEISLNDEMVILKGNTTLNPLQTSELSIRQTLCEVFRHKFSMISPTDFFYVKR